MMFQKKVIVLLVAQSSLLLASGFLAPTPFGLTTKTQKSFTVAGPLFSEVSVDASVEEEASEPVAEVASTDDDDSSEDVDEESDTESTEDDDEDVEEENAEEVAAPTKKERLTIFVGNLPFQTTDGEVRDMFAEYGKVELVSVPRNRETGQARGFAFVDMATQEELEKAIEGVHGTMFGGRTLRAAESLPKDQLSSQSKPRFAPQEGLRKIYVGNLAFDVERDALLEFYEQYGTVKDIYIPLDVGTGRPRGFAFVTVPEEDADAAIEATNGQEFMGRRLAVSVPLPRGQKAPPKAGYDMSGKTKLYVGNLSFYTTLDTLEEMFEEYGEVLDCYLPEDRDTGGSRGFAFVTMKTEDAMRAIDETDGYELEGRIIRVNEAEQPKGGRRAAPPRRDDFYDDDELAGDEDYPNYD